MLRRTEGKRCCGLEVLSGLLHQEEKSEKKEEDERKEKINIYSSMGLLLHGCKKNGVTTWLILYVTLL